jgi:hypothetical protein
MNLKALSTHEKNLSFMLQGNKIDCEDEVKRLGVTFDFKLTFNSVTFATKMPN